MYWGNIDMKPVAPAKWLAGVCAAMDLALTQWELRLILHRGEKQETKFMRSSITYLRHDLLSSLLIRPKRTQGACQFPHSRAMSDAAYSSSATVAANAAVAADAQPAPMDQGAMVKAMALRVKYRVMSDTGQPKRRIALHRLGVHP